MIQLIVGKEGSGKTKNLVERANALAKVTDGHIVYVDVDGSQIFRLDYSIRLVKSSEYPLKSSDEFFGFVCGILSQDYDLKTVFIDGLLKNAKADVSKAGELLGKVKVVSEAYGIDFVIGMACDPTDIPEEFRSYIQ